MKPEKFTCISSCEIHAKFYSGYAWARQQINKPTTLHHRTSHSLNCTYLKHLHTTFHWWDRAFPPTKKLILRNSFEFQVARYCRVLVRHAWARHQINTPTTFHHRKCRVPILHISNIFMWLFIDEIEHFHWRKSETSEILLGLEVAKYCRVLVRHAWSTLRHQINTTTILHYRKCHATICAYV